MLTPIKVRGDAADDVYEVVYRELPEGGLVDRDERVGPGVTASISRSGDILGLELIGLQATTVEAARRYARAHDLEFPADVAAALPQRRTGPRRHSG
ncbi:MAG TPA: hypothetical protein VGD01_00100 [Candidatus Elarobacter sp.]|jgi:hypothetical protein